MKDLNKTKEEKNFKVLDNSEFQSHYSFAIHVLITYSISVFFMRLLNFDTGKIYELLEKILGDFTTTILLSIFMLISTRILSKYFPEFNTEVQINWYVMILPIFILIHPVILVYSGNKFQVIWQIKFIIEEGILVEWIIISLIFAFTAFSINQILLNQDVKKEGELGIISTNASDYVLIAIGSFLSIVFAIESYFRDGLSFFDITFPIKIILYILMTYITVPINKIYSNNT